MARWLDDFSAIINISLIERVCTTQVDDFVGMIFEDSCKYITLYGRIELEAMQPYSGNSAKQPEATSRWTDRAAIHTYVSYADIQSCKALDWELRKGSHFVPNVMGSSFRP